MDPQGIEGGADAVDTPGTLHHARGVPVQIVVHEDAAILQVLSLGEHVG